MAIDKEEITRICEYYNENKNYAQLYSQSKDLGSVEEILPLVQKLIPELPGSLTSAWKAELATLQQMAYLNQVTKAIPKAAVRMTGIKANTKKGITTFSFAFNLSVFSRPGIKIQGISIISFGVDLILSSFGPAGKPKLAILKNIYGTEKFTPLKKAS
ncbi:MAG: hypothetical protein JWP12_2002 [Bacteroidetes bacterium]|nr:hypothetical protein [Bacteroidota bacterium]